MSQTRNSTPDSGELSDTTDGPLTHTSNGVKFPVCGRVLFALASLAVLLHFLFLFVLPRLFSMPWLFGRTWGFHFITYYSLPAKVVFYLLAIAVCVPPIAEILSKTLVRVFPERLRMDMARTKGRLFIILGVLSIPTLLMLGVKNVLLGDNFGIITRVVTNTSITDEFGSIFVLHFFYKAMHFLFSLNGWGAMTVFSFLCGGVFVYFALRFADEMGTTFFRKAAIFLFFVSFCTIEHFCGYIETYPLSVMLLTVYLYASILSIRGKLHFLVPALCLAAAIFCHFISLLFAPSFLYVLYDAGLKRHGILRKPRTWALALPLAAELIYLFPWKLAISHLMPLTSHNEMTMFSFAHVWEFINAQLLGCGPGLFIMPGCLAYAVWKRARLSPEIMFLIQTSVFIVTGLFVFRNLLGSSDWDVFSYSSLPVNMLAICLFFHLFGGAGYVRFSRYAVVVFIGLMTLHSAPWLMLNASDKSIRRFEDIIMSDPAYGWDDLGGFRPRISRIAIRMDQNGLYNESFRLYKKAYETDPGNAVYGYDYFSCLCERKHVAPARAVLRKIAGDDPVFFIAKSGGLMANAKLSGDSTLTVMVINLLCESLNNIGAARVNLGLRNEAIDIFIAGLGQFPTISDIHFNLGIALTKLHRYDEAILHYKEALRLKPDCSAARDSLDSIHKLLRSPIKQ